MKTITIPTYNNPFIVVINNKVYQYKGGETIEVPDEVAEAIEDAVELIPKPKRYLSRLAQLADGSISELTINDLDGAEIITNRAFAHCRSLQRVELPNCINKIGEEAFYGCESLKHITVGNGVTKICIYAFYNCISLTRIDLPEIPPVLDDVNAFTKVKSSCTFYCKSQASLDAYKTATNWSTVTSTYSFVVEE